MWREEESGFKRGVERKKSRGKEGDEKRKWGREFCEGQRRGKGGMDRGGGYGGDQTKRAFRSEPYHLVRDYDFTPTKFRCPRLNYPYYPSGAIQAVSRHFLLNKFDFSVANNFVILCSESFSRGSDPPSRLLEICMP